MSSAARIAPPASRLQALLLVLAGLCSPGLSSDLTTTVSQAAGTDWTAGIWKTNGVGTAVSPAAGNTYQCVSNGVPFGNGTSNTRIRNPTVAGIVTFPGTSLTLNSNTELRIKQASSGGPMLNFPGVSGNPGLILNGGVINVGDDAVFTITGKVQIAAQSYIAPSDAGGGAAKPLRGVNLAGQLTGSGTLVFMQGATTVPQRVSGAANTFTGKWVVKAGWLLASGADSLGTNSVTVDPKYVLPLDSSVLNVAGPALFEPGYDLNSAGTLILTNGGVMQLHQNCVFSAVKIEGAVLSAGTHSYAELVASFPNNFASGGSGSITVQPYGPPPALPPTITAQPSSVSVSLGGATLLAATASGPPPLAYQWQKGTNGVFINAADAGDVAGARLSTLNFSAVTASDAADYRLVVTNDTGSVTSQVATVTVLPPLTVAAVNPPAGSTLSNLTQIQVTFSRGVVGVDASDLLVNGLPASLVNGTPGDSNYTFTVIQPNPGTVAIAWDAGQGITDLAGNPFIQTAPGATWGYKLLDTIPPTVSALTPAAGAIVGHLTQVEVTFTKPVVGVFASSLLINGQAATNVTGAGSGPYLFQFPQPPNGVVQLSWAAGNAIVDTAVPPNAFAGGAWTTVLDPAAATPSVRINEFLAGNISTNGLRDQFGNLQDWIELYNFGTNSVNLDGYSLTDDPSVPDKWVFPSVTLDAGEFLVVFASGLDLKAVGGTNLLHTSFTLGVAGDYLALFNNETPRVALTEFAPEYPAQRNDYSFGYDSSNQLKYFAVPTPGAPNGDSSITGTVANVHFTVERGFFDQPFRLLLTTTTPGASIRYTLDGSLPTESAQGTTYTDALLIDQLSTVRAAAFQTNSLPSLPQTHTYIFLFDVLNQPTNPPGFPITSNWSVNLWPSEYGMNQQVVTNPFYSSEIATDLLAIPTLSIVMKTDEMFGPTGIYTNSPPRTSRPECACSVELLNPDGSKGFQSDAGIKIHGGGSADRPMKKPLALKFRGKYGAGALNYQFFPDSPLKSFDGGIVLRADYNNHWTHALTPYGSASLAQRARGGLVRDAFFKDAQFAMGDLSSHSRYVHLYINGLYWGVYNPCEDPDRNFAAAYLGGDSSDYDAIKGSDFQLAVDGDTVAYNVMLSYNNSGLANLTQYNQIKQYLDVTQYADYMLLQFYGANQDWGTSQNWAAIRNKNLPGALFKYLCWDDERTLEGVNDTPVGSALNSVSPSGLQANLVLNAEYRLLFADRVYKHLFNNGTLTTNTISSLWQARSAQIYQAIVGESARWGNSVPGGKLSLSPLPYASYTTNNPYYSRNENWLGEQGRLLTNYFPVRSGILLNQLRAAGLYPSVDAPVFNQFGGHVPAGFALTMSAPAGTIYYTTNGADPRVYGTGGVTPQASVYSGPVPLTASSVVRGRALSGATWSALADATFSVATLGVPLCITEIMYDPVGGDAYEFIELQNLGAVPLDVSGFSFKGLTYTFPTGSVLQPGAVVVLANNASPSAFATRYPGVTVFGYYSGNLDNGGERIAVLDRNGQTVTAVNYNDAGGWPTAAAGGGYSLEIIDPNGDPDAPANWRASTLPNGTPGLPPVAPPLGNVVLNEIMASNFSAVQNGTNFPDWVELYNRTTNGISLANWSLSNSGKARKFVFPTDTTLAAGEFLVVWCDTDTNAPGLHAGFELSRSGDNVFLYDANTNRVDAVSFGNQVTDLSIGRIDDTWQLTVPTPNATNTAAPLAPAASLAINEWLANPPPGSPDWLELYNASAAAPVGLQGLYLATSNDLFQVRGLSFVAPGGFLQLFADQLPGPEHLDLALPASGGMLALYDESGVVLDRLTYGAQSTSVSQGRFPDGSSNIVSFVGTASPGASNYLASYSGPMLNELMARNDSAVVDSTGNHPGWVELYNPTAVPYDLTNMSLGLSAGAPNQWVFPPGASIAAYGYLMVWCDASRPASTNLVADLNTGFALSGDGGAVYLFDTNSQVADSISFGPQVANLPIGRTEAGWSLLSKPTPAAANSEAVSLGDQANLRLNEWMASPLSGDDWFELYNLDASPVALSGLYFTDDPSLSGLRKFQVAPLSFIAGHGWVEFVADGSPSKGPTHVDFSLDANGETLRVYGADLTLIDSVDFGLQTPGISQGLLPDGGTSVTNLMVSTPGTSNVLPPPEPPTIDSIVPLVNGIVLQFARVAGYSYTVQYRDDLAAGSWLTLTQFSALPTNATSAVSDSSTNGGSTRFYRLLSRPGF